MEIFLDMDGVVANFLAGSMFTDEFHELFSASEVTEDEILDYNFYELAGIECEEWESWLYKSDEAFWADLPRTDDALDIVDLVSKFGRWNFLSHAVNTSAKIGKHSFIKNKLGRSSKNLICVDKAAQKANFATGPESILIDDLPANVEAWVAAGGTGILWGKPYNKNQNRGYPVANSVDELDEILTAVAMCGAIPEKLIEDLNADAVEIVESSTGGRKGKKPERFDLLPPSALAELARVYDFGASKYAPNNYRQGYEWSLSSAALLRHVFAFQEGEDDDPESGFSHLAHAAFHCLAIIQSIYDHGDRFDDRFGGLG